MTSILKSKNKNVSTYILIYHINHNFITVIKSKNTVGKMKRSHFLLYSTKPCACCIQDLHFRDAKVKKALHNPARPFVVEFKRHFKYFSH